METAVPSYLSLEHKQALASNVIPVNIRESHEEKGETPLDPIVLFFHSPDGFLCEIFEMCWMLLSSGLCAGALLGHAPRGSHINSCLCVFLASQRRVSANGKRCQDVTELFPFLRHSSLTCFCLVPPAPTPTTPFAFGFQAGL